MRRRVISWPPSAGLLVAMLALVAAVAGTAVAGPGATTSKLTKKKVAKIAVKEINRLAPGLSVAHADRASTADNANTAASANTAARADTAADADRLGGVGPQGYLRYGGTIPSGATVAGVFTAADEDDTGATTVRTSESFPVPAPAGLSDAQVNFAPSSVGGDDDSACSGSFNAPTAPAGKVCIYHNGTGDCFQDATATGIAIGGGGPQSRFGFGINGPACPTAGGNASIRGTWAYTAP